MLSGAAGVLDSFIQFVTFFSLMNEGGSATPLNLP
jgi:hypothetical protein